MYMLDVKMLRVIIIIVGWVNNNNNGLGLFLNRELGICRELPAGKRRREL